MTKLGSDDGAVVGANLRICGDSSCTNALSFKPYQNPIGPSILSWMHCTFGPSYPPVVFTCQSCIVWCLEP